MCQYQRLANFVVEKHREHNNVPNMDFELGPNSDYAPVGAPPYRWGYRWWLVAVLSVLVLLACLALGISSLSLVLRNTNDDNNFKTLYFENEEDGEVEEAPRIQTLRCFTDVIRPDTNVVIIDIVDSRRCANPKCVTFNFPPAPSSTTLEILSKSNRHVVIYNPSMYDNVKEVHFYRRTDRVVLNKKSKPLGGWTLESKSGPSVVEVSLVNSFPMYAHVLTTTRRMPVWVDGDYLQYANPEDPSGENERYDYIATVDLYNWSSTNGQIVNRAATDRKYQEFHHGLQTCGHIIATGLVGSTISVFALNDHERRPVLERVIDESFVQALNLSNLHTTIQRENGDLVISALSDSEGEGIGGFILLNAGSLSESSDTVDFISPIPPAFYYGNPLSKFINDSELAKAGMRYNYDIGMNDCEWFMISSEWTNRRTFEEGFLLSSNSDLSQFGTKIHVWNTFDLSHLISFDLGLGCLMPLEIRLLRGVNSKRAYVGCVVNATNLHGNVVAVYYDDVGGLWKVLESVIDIPPTPIPADPGFVALPEFNFTSVMPPIITDITTSPDNKFLYVATWLEGYLYQYDISDFFNPVFTDKILLGGFPITQPEDVYFNGTRILNGGPQMLRTTPNGEDIYVSNSLQSKWDQEFYGTFGTSPRSIDNGGWLLRVKTGVYEGKKVRPMMVDNSFFVDFANEPGGPSRPHEVHFEMFGNAHDASPTRSS